MMSMDGTLIRHRPYHRSVVSFPPFLFAFLDRPHDAMGVPGPGTPIASCVDVAY
jgi:hypothetical protein